MLSAGKGAVGGGHQAFLTLTSGTNEIAHAAMFTLIK